MNGIAKLAGTRSRRYTAWFSSEIHNDLLGDSKTMKQGSTARMMSAAQPGTVVRRRIATSA